MKRLLLLTAALVLLLPGTAYAHTGHFLDTWPASTSTVTFFLSSNNNWSNNQINALQAVDNEVNEQLAGTGAPTIVISSLEKDWGGCEGNWNIIEKVGNGYIPNGVAETQRCQNVLQTALSRAWIKIETPSNIYWGNDIPEPAGDKGARGIMVHELIHALGMNHFSDSDNTVCDYGLGSGSYATMCVGPYWNGSYLQYNRNITLTNHDVHTVNNAY